MPMKQILSIQSAVTCGFVGNSVAAPVITTLGMQPLLIDTISLAAHPGYGTIAGGPADQTQFSAILEALTTLRVLPQINNVITGYLGDARQAVPIHSMIQNWQTKRHDGLYILDPVLGDGGRLYVDSAVVDQIRQTVCAHPPAGGQAEAEQNAVKNVAFSRAVRPRHHGEPLLEGDRHRPTERLELRQPDLIDVNQQERGLSANRK